MASKLPPTLSICLGTCTAALLLGLQNIDEYCQQLESNHPELSGLAEGLKETAYSTGIPGIFNAEKKILSGIAAKLPMLDKPAGKPLPPPPQVVYVRVPSPAQLDTLRLLPVKREDTLSAESLVVMPPTELLQTQQAPKQEPTQEQTPQQEKPQPLPPPKEATPPPVPEPAPTVQEQPLNAAKANEKHPVHCRIMLLGDSLMEDLGPTTHRTLRHRKGLHFILTAKYSTGLSRPDYFNWPENMEKAVADTRPDIIVFFMGANDGMPIKANGKNVYPNSGEPWRKAYRQKMAELFDIARRYGSDMIWLGLPPMGSRYAKILAQTALAQQEGCAEHGICFLDTKPILGDENGNFRTYMTDSNGKTIRLRSKDKEHLAPMGNKLVVEQLIPVLEQKIADYRTKHPEKRLSKEEAARPGRAPLDITIKYVPGKR